MTWKISWSWQAPSRIATILAVDEGVIISTGLQLNYINAKGDTVWSTNVPFKVHGLAAQSGRIGVLMAHGFYIYSLTTAKQMTEGRSTPAGFKEIMARPGGGWVLSCRKGQLHLFSAEGRGIRRMESGSVRRLLGWLDREHLLWQDNDGIIWCGRLTDEDKKRKLEDRVWSWISSLNDGRLLLQSGDGAVWEGVPHPFGWDKLECIETMSIEPMNAVRTGDGWWTLSLDGELHHLGDFDNESQETPILGKDMELGDLLSHNVGDSMFTATREGLVRKWSAPHLFDVERQSRYKAVADAAMARNWEDRRQMFLRAQEAEDVGKVSLAIELYEALGRKEDVRRLLSRQKGDDVDD